MKKRLFILIMIILFFGILINLITSRYHFFYSSICGTGFNGIKLLIIYYLPVIAIVLTMLLIIKKRKAKYKCKFCNEQLEELLNICPYCGKEMGGDDIVV